MNTVPDVLRQLLVWDDPRVSVALLVDVVGFRTGLLAQLWVTGALSGPAVDGRPRFRGSLLRGTGLAWAAVRSAPATVAAVSDVVASVVTLPLLVLVLVLAGQRRLAACDIGQ